MGAGQGSGKAGSREVLRIVMWMVWVTVWLITSIFVALAVITFAKMWQAASELQYGASDLAHNKIWRAPLASLVLSALLVFGFNMMCCVTLIKKSVNRSGPGFGYGFMVAFSISLSTFLLLSGLVLDGFRPVVKQNLEPQYNSTDNTLISGAKSWSTYSSQSFVGTEVFALISFVVYLLFGLVMIMLQGAVSDQLGINEAAGYTRSASPGPGLPGLEAKGAPAAPPDYDSYAQYEQYGYAQDGTQQQYYDPNALGLGYGVPQAPVDPGQVEMGTAGYAVPQGGGYGYAPAAPFPSEMPSQGSYGPAVVHAPPMYANTGYGAVNMYSTATVGDDNAGADSALLAGHANGAPVQGNFRGGNQQI